MKRLLRVAAWGCLWLAGPALFLVREQAGGVSGFPLDDAWIHQTYARSLAGGLGWSYAGGPQSAGSTSPLWTLLQVPAFWFSLPPKVWSSVLGIVLLAANAGLIGLWIRRIDRGASRLAFFFCLAEWHLVWAALSGMETVLFCTWISAILFLFFPVHDDRGGQSQFPLAAAAMGALSGMGVWIRPEALLLTGLAGLAAAIQWRPVSAGKAAGYLAGAAMPIFLYAALEYSLNGRMLPNTYFVKTVEYTSLTSTTILIRLLQPWIPLLAGPIAVLAFFLPSGALGVLRGRGAVWGLPLLWAVAHLALYAVQLPATYQHGRYFIPVLPVLIAYGTVGGHRLWKKHSSAGAGRIAVRTLSISAAGLAAAFLWIGAGQFAEDVRLIESEMVAASVWIRDHMPPETVVAAHDIGALGFFGGRRILDLGGVTDLGAVNLLAGKISLREYLERGEADLLMTMPDFYPGELDSCTPLEGFSGGIPAAESSRRTRIYLWREACAW
ncbi:MAG: hypothetical protein JW929_09170 [Anaerolineales bacterium]|nr:hypothetical protein [Anaerolineales bacterium]